MKPITLRCFLMSPHNRRAKARSESLHALAVKTNPKPFAIRHKQATNPFWLKVKQQTRATHKRGEAIDALVTLGRLH
ncbi:hypothetical protein Poly41_13870 [Novipirellula artificiosorum]|uniref:Uncharacterized protein n=1 Tax=Novipirellula artificiosorum TaxID=2528016 RepID=A0A5C6DWE6_9BACT|nr:hypothetical protein Poly41_13870 [Novipirellula artificiosorum]